MPIEAQLVFPDKPKKSVKHRIYPGEEKTIPYLEGDQGRLAHISCGRGDMHGEIYHFDAREPQNGFDTAQWQETSEADGTTIWCGQSFDQRITDISGEEAILIVQHVGQFATYLCRN